MKEDWESLGVKDQSSNRKPYVSLYLSRNVHSTAVKPASKTS